ncbi:beta-aspartyl-peptidase [Acidaminobacter sp. JC074]|uniref:beta-aspartyl-peptidase n=1 Tax=Acidaminobacter sp. JC074 TaxID=2530199 RepID=UPI001F1186D6|nr:beta-aspartyl-peptidase [Acidaminobacter sp. JC074]MCH4888523.1 beta-aspartyl-peptidase [Acidaminobacter sp. JC074]
MILLKNGYVYSPEKIGVKDILLAGNKIVAIEDKIDLEGLDVEVLDCSQKNILPGFIDSHVHIMGGGGEGSFKTRTPEIQLSDITTAGVTTVVGCIGTDGTTRSMKALLAKAYALEEEGISTYVYTGSYEVPVKTLMDSIRDDIILIEKVIGVGEIALSDHRSSVPSLEELCKLTADASVAGMLSGKAGIVNIHLGDSKEEFDLLHQVTEVSDLSLDNFLPTHVNRNKSLFLEGISYAKAGGHIDFTTSTTDYFLEQGEVSSPKALRIALEENVAIDRITFTSDGQGSLPEFDENNRLVGLTIGKLSSLYDSVRQAVQVEGLPLELAIKVITENPAHKLNLKSKGRVRKDYDADIVIVDQKTLEINHVIAKGRLMVKDKEVLVKGTFE